MPRAPRSRQRLASPIGSSARSRRTNGISFPPERAAYASVRLLPAWNPGWRSGSSRQNTKQRVVHDLESTFVVRIRAVPDVFIYGDTVRSPELRHEVPLAIPDQFLYVEKGDRRAVVIHSLEIPRVREAAPNLEIVPIEQLG